MRLDRREKWVLAVCGGALLMWGVYRWGGIHDSMDRIATLRRVVPEQEKTFKQLQERCREYGGLHSAVDAVQRRIPQGDGQASAAVTLDRIARESGCKVAEVQPEETPLTADFVQTRVNLRLEGVTLAQLTDFLKLVARTDIPMGVRTLQVATTPRNDLLNVDLEVISMERARRGAGYHK